jgi:hypothetical protein
MARMSAGRSARQAWQVEVVAHGRRRRPAEDDVQFLVAEDERFGAVDENQVKRISELVGQPGGNLQTAKSGTTQHDHTHGGTLPATVSDRPDTVGLNAARPIVQPPADPPAGECTIAKRSVL